jgi:hypothetical protein
MEAHEPPLMRPTLDSSNTYPPIPPSFAHFGHRGFPFAWWFHFTHTLPRNWRAAAVAAMLFASELPPHFNRGIGHGFPI